jgi:hypothetical protein
MTDAPWGILAIAVPISQRLSFMYIQSYEVFSHKVTKAQSI